MSSEKLLQNYSLKKITDPNELQSMASDPVVSAWVGASAGTGKTKVLTDRVLRLLLPRQNGAPGSAPSKILCLTFTKAAAAEMAERITQRLSVWAVCDDMVLEKDLKNLLLETPTEEQKAAAQNLFANVIDDPVGLQIMTIHSFCQSVLGRFPLEADLPPNFDILEEAAVLELLDSVVQKIMYTARMGENLEIEQAFDHVAQTIDEKSFSLLVRKIVQERFQMATLFSQYRGYEALRSAMLGYYGLDSEDSEEEIFQKSSKPSIHQRENLLQLADVLRSDGSKAGPSQSDNIRAWLQPDAQDRNLYEKYKTVFLTVEGDMRSTSRFPVQKAKKLFPQCTQIVEEEAQRLIALEDRLKCYQSAVLTSDLLLLGYQIISLYEKEKASRSALDFDDLIIYTLELLQHKEGNLDKHNDWIMYKLDQGLDHILVDEAQDTNPEQWRIIDALTDEFFSGFGARDDILRTVFTVGDIKQSIYKFQRASPEAFSSMQEKFSYKIQKANKMYRNVALDISFRSTKSVLHVVDQVFKAQEMQNAMGGVAPEHQSFRNLQAGSVTLWPLYEDAEKVQKDFWEPPTVIQDSQSASAQLASHIASTIRNWMDRKEKLEGRDKIIEPGDIMILVRSRTALVDQIVRALKLQKIPVSGSDRMVLNEQLVVQDVIALAQFCLLPTDDLIFSTVLKSPFLNWAEDELFAIAYDRQSSVWQALKSFSTEENAIFTETYGSKYRVLEDKVTQTRTYLENILRVSKTYGIYEFFSYLLNTQCPASTVSGLHAIRSRLGEDVLDALDEFLNNLLNYTKSNPNSLQHFISYHQKAKVEIKRELEVSSNQVRIMTVHGSKGLQAPIVILPDTIKLSGQKADKLLWPDENRDLPIFAAHKDSAPEFYKKAQESERQKELEEYYRLLYVAMTRAEDRLYIGGYQGKQKAQENSWYFRVRSAMDADPLASTLEDGSIVIKNEQEADPKKMQDINVKTKASVALPEWIRKSAPEEPVPPRPLVPSQPSVEEMAAAASPLMAADQNRFRRGNLTHKLLQFLPDFDEGKRRAAAQIFVEKNANDLSANVRESIVNEVMAILEHPDYAVFFVKGSLAEVPVTGLMEDNRIVSGQIDRLVVTEKDIWVIDYKTNRPPPKDPKDIPAVYRKQMAAYCDALRRIYPDCNLHAALLWTDGPSLMVL
ncbi:MAG: double-strand break repair helicase AddA [Alphaproteobacteria bacterium]|nr:double-strand break repair helicase AddA [Alphaproteobacteria bacterium]